MAKPSSSFSSILARCLKAVMVAVLLPLPIGVLAGILEQLDLISLSGATYREWVTWGFVAYIGFHVLLYRPVTLFRMSHRVFSMLALWLFGGQVSSVEGAGEGPAKKDKGHKGQLEAQGSTLVAFSPYVIPVYTVLICALGWLSRQWGPRSFVYGPVSFLIGATMGFHWLMTADGLQQQRKRWHVETYLLAISLVFLLTLLVSGVCLPWAMPEFSFIQALADGLLRAKVMYTSSFQQLFF